MVTNISHLFCFKKNEKGETLRQEYFKNPKMDHSSLYLVENICYAFEEIEQINGQI